MPIRVSHLLVFLALGGCADLMCANRPVRTADAPDGGHVAVIFERDCGATTDFSTQISILPPGTAARGTGNIFIAEAGTGPRAPWGGPPVTVEWLTNDRLIISHPRGAEMFKRAREREEIRIEYRPYAAGN